MKILWSDKLQSNINSRSDINELFRQEAAAAWEHYSSRTP